MLALSVASALRPGIDRVDAPRGSAVPPSFPNVTFALHGAAQALAVLLVPFVQGAVAGRVTAALTGRRGAPLLQPWHDLRRALHKRPLALRPGALIGLAAALSLGLLAPLVGPRSPFAFTGDVAAFAGLLALWHRLARTRPRPFVPAPALAIVALAFAGRDVSLSTPHLGASASAWAVDALSLCALTLALRLHRAEPPTDTFTDATDGPSELGLVAHRAGAAVVAASLAGLLASRLHAGDHAWPSVALHLALLLAIAAALGVVAARRSLPRPRPQPLRLAAAAVLGALALTLARGAL